MKNAAVLAGLALAALASPAAAQVAVVSLVDGRPFGQPPGGTERRLRIGTDVQAGERIVTGAGDRVHLVFRDGTALTIGGDSALVAGVDGKATAIAATRGTFRLVGGGLKGDSETTVATPSGTIELHSAIASVEVGHSSTKAILLSGTSMGVTSLGVTQTATRAGSQISVANGRPPMLPFIVRGNGMPGTERFERPAVAVPNPGLLQSDGTLPVAVAKPADDAAPQAMTTSTDSGPTNTAIGSDDQALLRLSKRNERIDQRAALRLTNFKPPATIVRPQSNPAQHAVTHHTVNGGADTRAKTAK